MSGLYSRLAVLAVVGAGAVGLSFTILNAQEEPAEEAPPAEAPPEASEPDVPEFVPEVEEPSGPPSFQPSQAGGYTATQGGDYVLNQPPSSLDGHYPPIKKYWEYANQMDSLGAYFWELKIDVTEKDWGYTEFSYRRFAKQYKIMAEMVPEWSEYWLMDDVKQMMAELGLVKSEAKEEKVEEEGVEGEEGVQPTGMTLETKEGAVKLLEKIEKESCNRCHTEQRFAVVLRYYWADRGSKHDLTTFRMKDPVSRQEMDLAGYMNALAISYNGVLHSIGKGKKKNTRGYLAGLDKQMSVLDKTCSKCHDEEPGFYTGRYIKEQITTIKNELKRASPSKGVLRGALATIYKESCGGCHLAHMGPSAVQKVWFGKTGE